MADLPFTFIIPTPSFIPTRYDNHIHRRLSEMKGQFYDEDAYQKLLAAEDSLVYEVYETKRPQISGEVLHGISIIHPGKVGREFYMTKGHYHAEIETAEVYLCLNGEGFMVMENPEGEFAVEALAPGVVLYVPPRWAHRSVCTSRQRDLVTFFAYPGHSGHDYGTIERQGFARLVLEGENGIEIVHNPRWNRPY